MHCSNCGREIRERDRYCQWCGAPNAPESPPETAKSDQLTTSEQELRALRASVDSMTADLARLQLRLSDLERSIGTSSAQTPPFPSTPSVPPVSPVPPTSSQPPAVLVPSTVNEVVTGPAGEGHQPPTAPARSAAAIPRTPGGTFSDWNWEWLLGGNWLARIGIVALIFGVAFFISLAIDRGWLGEIERVLLGVAAGLVFLAAGEYFRNRYGVWAQTVSGGGIAILYLSVYGAFALYALISTELALGSFALITLAGALLSLRHEAMGVAVLSIFGGFATPLLLQDELPSQRLLLIYVLVLDVGVLALAAFRNWQWFTLLAWAGSLILFAFWHFELEPSTALAQVGITAIFLVFVGATVAFNIVRKRTASVTDLVLVTANAIGYFGISYGLMGEAYRDWMGGFTALVALFYIALGAAFRLRGSEQLNLTLFAAGLAVVFAVLAVPIQFGGPWISIAWAAEGLVLLWLSFPLRMRELRWAGYLMFLVSGAWLLLWDTPAALTEDFTPFLNEYMISYAGAMVIPALAAVLLHLRRRDLDERELISIPLMVIRVAIFAAAVIPVQVTGGWVPIAWAVEALLALALSSRLHMVELRWFSYALFAATLVRLLAVDTLGVDSETFRPVVNLRFLAFFAGIAALYVSGWAAIRTQQDFAPSRLMEYDRLAAFPALLAAANVATLWLFSFEILASADSSFFGLSQEAEENVASLGLSLLWAIYAAVLIVLGVVRRWRWVRLAGLALLALPVIKLFAYDSRTLEQEYRVIAFIALGLILLAGGLLYQRYSRAVRGFLFE